MGDEHEPMTQEDWDMWHKVLHDSSAEEVIEAQHLKFRRDRIMIDISWMQRQLQDIGTDKLLLEGEAAPLWIANKALQDLWKRLDTARKAVLIDG